jgi:hypothetical protein
VNTSRLWYEYDPFILACQASQVFYLNDTKFGSSWKVVQIMSHRNIYDIPIVSEGRMKKMMKIMVLGIMHLFNKQLMKTQLRYTELMCLQ